MSLNEFQVKLSDYQMIPVVGPLIVSPVKAFVSLAQTVTGVAVEIIFGTLTSVFESFGPNKLAQMCDDLCYKGVSIRTKGSVNLLSAIFNFITFGTMGYWLEEKLELRYRKITDLKT